MKTTKAFSTISYNTPDFLTIKLDGLVQRRVISFYAFVRHYKEEDEKKDHIHLFVVPNGQYQTDALVDYLQEADPSDFTKKPLGIMPCQSSKFGDWFLYSCHDTAYLASKGQTRGFHYALEDFVSSDSDYLLELVHTIDRSPYVKTQDFVKAVQGGANFYDMVSSGQVPAIQFNQWFALFNYVKNRQPFRNGRESHSPLDSLSEGVIDRSNPKLPRQLVLNADGSQTWWYIDPETAELLEPVDEFTQAPCDSEV